MNNTTAVTPPPKHGILPVIAITLLTFTATLIAGYITEQAVKTRLRNFFNRQADQISNTYYSNLYTHIIVLEGLRGLWNTSGSFDRASFLTYINSLSLDHTYEAGVSSFFFITPVPSDQTTSFTRRLQNEKNTVEPYSSFSIHPESTLGTLYPITYVEPVAGRETTVGLDFGTFPDRLAAIEYARDENALATTGTLTLISTGRPGFFFLLPLYRPGLPTERRVERRSAFAGVVGAAFRSRSAFAQIFGSSDDPYPYLDFQIYQGDAITPDRLLHDHDEGYSAQEPLFEATRVVRIQNQSWTILVQSKPNFALGDPEERLPMIVFGSGLIMTVLIALYSLHKLAKIRQTRSLLS